MKKEFVEKILRVQEQLKAPKSNYNSFGKYRYRSLEDILTAAKPLLASEGLMLTIKDDVEQIGDRYYIKAIAEITDGEDSVKNTALAREEDVKKGMDGSQITGTASSYARKYCLNGLLLIDDTKDADTDEFRAQSQRSSTPYPHSGEKKRQTPKKMTAKAVDTLVQILMDEKIPLDKFMKQYGISELKELPFEVYEKVYKDHTQKAVQDA